jgi:hypothetical protein
MENAFSCRLSRASCPLLPASWSTRLPPGQPVCLLVNVIRIPYFGLSVITGLSAIG